MNPIVYKSTDSGAPVLNGTLGAMITLLDACLVNGYGALSPLGWTKPYSASNCGVYRAPAGSIRHFVQVNDNGLSAGGAKEAYVFAWESMSAFGVGTQRYPTAAVSANGVYWRKSSTADSTARTWTLIGDDKTFYLWVSNAASTQSTGSYAFGEIETNKAGDQYNSLLSGTGTLDSNTPTWGLTNSQGSYGITTGANGFWLARSFTQVGTGHNAVVVGPGASTTNFGNVGIPYPNGPDGATYVGPIIITETGSGTPIRGRVRGIYVPLHVMAFSQYDTVTNVQGLSGVTLLCVNAGNANNPGQLLVDITGPW